MFAEIALLIDIYGEEIVRRSSVLYLDHFINQYNLSGDTCLEIGTNHGLTALSLLKHFNKVISIDINDSPYKRKITKGRNIEFIHINGNEDKSLIELLDFDFAYVDGNRIDAREDFERVKHCGRVLFHDHWSPEEPVWDLVKNLNLCDSHYWEKIIESPMAYVYQR